MTSTHSVPDSAPAALTNLVDIVTVNWNAGRQLADCINSVRQHDERVVHRFIVVDNGSSDGSADLAINWPKLLIDKVNANLGFGRACNRGARQGDAPFILFLNPDARLTEPAISDAIAFLQSQAGNPYAVCGIKLIDESGEATRHCARFPTVATFAGGAIGINKISARLAPPLLMTDFDHLSSRPVNHVQGAFYLVRRSAFETVGGFDEDYFVYFEDLDLSLRLNRAGFESYYLATASAFHRGAGTSSQVKAIARFYGTEARMLYTRKHFGRVAQITHTLTTYTLEPLAALAWYAGKHRGRGMRGVLKAFWMLLRHTPDTLSGISGRVRGEQAAKSARGIH